MAVIVVVADTNALTPAVPHQSCLLGYVAKRPVAIVAIKVVGRLFAIGKVLKSPAVDHENIEPTIVIVVEKRDTAAGRGKQKVFTLMANKNRLRTKAGFFGDVHVMRKIDRRNAGSETSGKKRI